MHLDNDRNLDETWEELKARLRRDQVYRMKREGYDYKDMDEAILEMMGWKDKYI